MERVTLPEGAVYYTVGEVANHLRVAKMTVYRMLHAGEMPGVRVGARVFRVPAEEFHKWEREIWEGQSSGSAASGGEQSEGSS